METIEAAIARHWEMATAYAAQADTCADLNHSNADGRAALIFAQLAQMHYRAVEIGLALYARPDISLTD